MLNQFGPSDTDEFNLTMMQQFCRLCGLGYCFRHCEWPVRCQTLAICLTLVFLAKDKPNPLEKMLSTDDTLGQELDKFCSDLCFLSLDPSKALAIVRVNLNV